MRALAPIGTPAARPAAIAAVFVANGLGGPSFLARLPDRQAALGLSDAGLGLVLTGMAAGALLASPAAGRAVGRLGSRPVAVGAGLALGAGLWTVGAAPHPVVLFAALAAAGAADAAMDVAMNANGAAYERGTGRSLLHRLHGAWSLGSLTAAGAAAAAATLDVPLGWHLLVVGAVIVAVVLAARRGLETGDRLVAGAGATTGPGPGSAERATATGRAPGVRLVGPMAALAAVTVAGAVIEGGPSDWSALRLERLGTGAGAAALGFAAFTAGMLAGRLVGDHLTDRVGAAAVLRGGMGLVTAGLLAGVLVDQPAVLAAGLAVAGLGASGLFPLVFSAAATTPGVAPGVGAATISLAARLGFMAEPVLMGALAEALGLRWAFAAVAAVAAAVALAAGRVLGRRAGVVRDEGAVADLRTG